MAMAEAALDAAALTPWSRQLIEDADGPAKRKRSRRQHHHHLRTAPTPTPTEEEHLALCVLMLARGQRDVAARGPAPAPSSPSPSPHQEHRCSVCGRTFSSHQALGGHMSSHRHRASRTPATTTSAPADDDPASSSASPAASPSTSAASGTGRVHECSVCRKAFPTGEALGGHKRCHYEGSAGASTTVLLSNRGFDLSVPALPDLMVDADWCMLPPAAEAEEVLSPSLAFKKPRPMIMA